MKIAFMSNNKETKAVYFADKELVDKLFKQGYEIDFTIYIKDNSDNEEFMKIAEMIARRR